MEIGSAAEGELMRTATEESIETAVAESAERACEMKCGASGVPEDGYDIFVCAGCLDRAADLARAGQMEFSISIRRWL